MSTRVWGQKGTLNTADLPARMPLNPASPPSPLRCVRAGGTFLFNFQNNIPNFLHEKIQNQFFIRYFL